MLGSYTHEHIHDAFHASVEGPEALRFSSRMSREAEGTQIGPIGFQDSQSGRFDNENYSHSIRRKGDKKSNLVLQKTLALTQRGIHWHSDWEGLGGEEPDSNLLDPEVDIYNGGNQKYLQYPTDKFFLEKHEDLAKLYRPKSPDHHEHLQPSGASQVDTRYRHPPRTLPAAVHASAAAGATVSRRKCIPGTAPPCAAPLPRPNPARQAALRAQAWAGGSQRPQQPATQRSLTLATAGGRERRLGRATGARGRRSTAPSTSGSTSSTGWGERGGDGWVGEGCAG
jgi:hypothetical protein